MNKSTAFIFELFGFISTVMGIVGLFQSANEIMYRREPIISSMLINEDILAMANNNDKDLLEQLLAINMNSVTYNDPDRVLNELTRIIHEHPDYFKGYYDRGLIYLSAGRVDEGFADMQVVIQRSDDHNLRQQARSEITLAQIARMLTPVPFLGLAVAAILFMANLVGVKFHPSLRTIKVFIVAFVLWMASFFFLLLY